MPKRPLYWDVPENYEIIACVTEIKGCGKDNVDSLGMSLITC